MNYVSVTKMAEKWGISERSVRNYCAEGRIPGAFITGKTWNIPEDAEKPERTNKKSDRPKTLLGVLKAEKDSHVSGGIYHKVQIDLTYNSNHIEGSRLTHDQTRYIFETNTIRITDESVNVDDIIETSNHFRCIDMIIDGAKQQLSEKFIKELHLVLKTGTSDSRKDWFAVGEYKRFPNEVGGRATAAPEEVSEKLRELLTKYNAIEKKTIEDLIAFHVEFERIHPFQDGNGRIGRLILFKECLKHGIVPFIIEDGNGRIGRLILFKECLKHGIVPFIIEDDIKMFYYRGLNEWNSEEGYLMDICLTAQDRFKKFLEYFRIDC